ncbi:MAG TPA: MBL fold metallo-hydrolase [Solirubrobacteraceae bacterium]|jgi:glyoxylase-like metal-dependent hydrolase (beta-lactamase superfamily II)|nr:MBL fold metallo-hydrolase [Solirubrobacteraceae bacterium]
MPAVTRLTRLAFVNCYLVPEDDGLTLIDAMLPRSAKKILRASDDLAGSIVRIVLTHAHMDHVGSLDELASELPGVEVVIGARDARLLAGDMSTDQGEIDRKITGSFKKLATTPTRTVVEGERIGSLEAISAPGHTPGHMAYIDTRDRTLFCGDTFATLGGVAVSSKPNPRFPLVYMGTWDRAGNTASARKLRALDPARLAPGHGKIVESPGAAMDRAIARVS